MHRRLSNDLLPRGRRTKSGATDSRECLQWSGQAATKCHWFQKLDGSGGIMPGDELGGKVYSVGLQDVCAGVSAL